MFGFVLKDALPLYSYILKHYPQRGSCSLPNGIVVYASEQSLKQLYNNIVNEPFHTWHIEDFKYDLCRYSNGIEAFGITHVVSNF